MNPRALLVKDVKFRWAKAAQPVLDIPEFAVRAGERVLIKGASGSGKTTLLKPSRWRGFAVLWSC